MTRRIRTLIVFLAILAPLVAYAVMFILDYRLATRALIIGAGLFLVVLICRVVWSIASGVVQRYWPTDEQKTSSIGTPIPNDPDWRR